MDQSIASALRSLPAVEEVLAQSALASWFDVTGRDRVVSAVRQAIDDARAAIRTGAIASVNVASIASSAAMRLEALIAPRLRPVINATGIIVHTNLGRSPLAPAAIESICACARGYSTLEYNLDQRKRGSRQDLCERLLRELTGAEAALVVNNNAAAVLLVLTALAQNRDVIVSRGELIEIGGSFRIPDIMAASGATMIEVGTTNKTHRTDYERAINDQTALLLKVHPSNYAVVGFNASVDTTVLHELAVRESERRGAAAVRKLESRDVDHSFSTESAYRELWVYEDLGSGCLISLDTIGAHEPTVAETLGKGCDLVSFSGDKLLGGPQAGIIVGRADLIDCLRRHPMMRALRPDKLTLAALEATLSLSLNPALACASIPTLRMLTESVESVRARAEALLTGFEQSRVLGNGVAANIAPTVSCAGGGSLPQVDIASYGVELVFTKGSADSCQRFIATDVDTPIVARIHDEKLIFDARTLISDTDIDAIVNAVAIYSAR